MGGLFATLAGEPICQSSAWPDGAWPDSPWGTVLEYGRKRDELEIVPRSLCKSQLVFGDSAKDSAFGDINACYGVPRIPIAGKAPKWGDFAWSDDEPKISFVAIEECFEEKRRVQCEDAALAVGFASQARHESHAFALRRDEQVWSEFEWSGGSCAAMGMGSRTAILAGCAEYASQSWRDCAWPAESWGEVTGYGRPQEPFGIVIKGES